MSKDPKEAHFPVRVVVRRTGLNPSLLRAWERRYGVVTPERTPGGQRLYSEADVRRLILLRDAVAFGHNISQLAGLPNEGLRGLAEAGVAPEVSVDQESGGPSQAYLEDALLAVVSMDTRGLDAILHRAAMRLSPEALMDEVLVVLLREIGTQWRRGAITPGAEHMASAVLRRFMDWLIASLESHDPKGLVLVGTPRGQVHEFGALMAAAVCAAEGWKVLSMGADLPWEEFVRVVERKSPRVVALSALHPPDAAGLVQEMSSLRSGVGPEVRVLIGGPAATAQRVGLEKAGLVVLGDFGDLRRVLGAAAVV